MKLAIEVALAWQLPPDAMRCSTDLVTTDSASAPRCPLHCCTAHELEREDVRQEAISPRTGLMTTTKLFENPTFRELCDNSLQRI